MAPSTEVFEAVRTVMAVREYDGRPIAAESVLRIVEAALSWGPQLLRPEGLTASR